MRLPAMQAKRSTWRRSIAWAIGVTAVVWGGVAWRLWLTERVSIEGQLRAGSLRCRDECHFDFVIEGRPATSVRADTCIMPDALRDWPGRPVNVMTAGKWEGQSRLKATALLVKDGYRGGPKPSGGRPPECFVPPAER